MAALDFPSSPAVNDTYTAGGKTWLYNGTSWISYNSVTGGGYYKGNAGTNGDAANANNLFRVNVQYIANNITIGSTENAIVTGPITINTGYNLTISTGGRAVII